MFDATVETIEGGRVMRYVIAANNAPLTYAQVLDLWQQDDAFRTYFISLLSESPFAGYRWETPAITVDSCDRLFEFVLVDSPGFSTRRTDSRPFQNYFTTDDADEGIVTFDNLRKDAQLIVPSPRTQPEAYGHLAAFIRLAPAAQVNRLWQVTGRTLANRLQQSPIWLSTAGGGVAWLHIRLDSSPKYYSYSPYKTI
ncbi:MAG: hypothetical protein AAF528_11140 [Cyanobacteria bacterium P01_C01_bin.121]